MSGYNPRGPGSPWHIPQFYRGASRGLPTLSEDAFSRLAERAAGGFNHPEPNGNIHLVADSQAQETRVERLRGVPGFLRIASLHELPSEFHPIGAGFFRHAHEIWELRVAEDEQGGYVLARKREERAVDMRSVNASMAEVAFSTAETRLLSASRVGGRKSASPFKIGQHVAAIVQGEVIPVMIMQLDDGQAEVQKEEDGLLLQVLEEMLIGAPAEEEAHTCPMCGAEPLAELEPPPCACEGGQAMGQDPMEPPLSSGPESFAGHSEDLDIGSLFGGGANGQAGTAGGQRMIQGPKVIHIRSDRETPNYEELERPQGRVHDIDPSVFDAYSATGSWVEPNRDFQPVLMGGSYTFEADGPAYEVDGVSKANQEMDNAYGVPSPESSDEERIRLVPRGGGEPVFVTPEEFALHFSFERGSGPEARSRSVPGESPPELGSDFAGEMPGEVATPAEQMSMLPEHEQAHPERTRPGRGETKVIPSSQQRETVPPPGGPIRRKPKPR